MEAVPSLAGPFGTKLYQVGMYAPDFDAAMSDYGDLDYDDWSTDTLVHDALRWVGSHGDNGLLWEPYRIRAYLAFNYDALPLELELLACRTIGDNKPCNSRGDLIDVNAGPFLHHMCARVDNLFDFITEWASFRGPLMTPDSVFVSEQHTNPAMVGNHRVAGVYYDMADQIGYKIKVVQRIDWDSTLTPCDLLLGLPIQIRP